MCYAARLARLAPAVLGIFFYWRGPTRHLHSFPTRRSSDLASVGQGTGVGGFLGLDEPNLFGQGKKGHFQWQFGKNISDFSVSYTDPAIHESRISGTFDVHNTRLRYTIADLGTLRRRGASVQFGFPVFSDRYTRLFVSYGIDDQTFTGSSTGLASLRCNNCIRSTFGVSLMRDTRIDLPFPTGGTMHSLGL